MNEKSDSRAEAEINPRVNTYEDKMKAKIYFEHKPKDEFDNEVFGTWFQRISITTMQTDVRYNEQYSIYRQLSTNPFLSNFKSISYSSGQDAVEERLIVHIDKSKSKKTKLDVKIVRLPEVSSKFSEKIARLHRINNKYQNQLVCTRKLEIEPEDQTPALINFGFKSFLPVSKKNVRKRLEPFIKSVSMGSMRKIVEFKLYKNERAFIKNLERFENRIQSNNVDNDVDTSKSEIERAVIKVRNDISLTLQPVEDLKAKIKRHKSVIINRVCRNVILARDSNVV